MLCAIHMGNKHKAIDRVPTKNGTHDIRIIIMISVYRQNFIKTRHYNTANGKERVLQFS